PVALAAGQVIGKVTVTVNGITENATSANVHLLLVGPHGQEVVLMAGTGNAALSTPIDLTFDDAAPDALPQSSALTSGTVRPTSYSTQDFSQIGGPGGPYPEAATQGTAALATQFTGTDPNGTWSLYAPDNGSGFLGPLSGSITGWSLNITPGYSQT